MRIFIVILLSTIFTKGAFATNFYVSNTGSDAANGLTTGTAWQTIAHVNAHSFSAGDSILFQTGGSWNETLIVPSSGAAGNHIIFASYGSGAMPIITGLQSQGGFSASANIWTTTATNSVKKLNVVLVGGVIQQRARTPNTGWSTFSSHSGQTQISGTGLSGTPNYTGSNLVVRTAHWIIDNVLITSQSGATLNFNPALTYEPILGGNGFFIQNTPSDLDVAGEWTYDSASKVLKVYATSTPTVLISTIDTLIYLKKKNYITFSNLNIIGANTAGIQIDSCSNIVVKHCNMNYSGNQGIVARHSQHVVLKVDSISNSLSNGIYMREFITNADPNADNCDSTKMDSLYIHNVGTMAGMGQSNNFQYFGINVNGNDDTLTNIVIDSVGYVPIFWNGKRNIIEYNLVTTFGYIKDDGGGIYTAVGGMPLEADTGSVVRHNIVLHGIGAQTGVSDIADATGLYFDNQTSGVDVDSNTVIDSYVYAMILNGSTHLQNHDNTIVDSLGNCFFVEDFAGGNSTLNLKRNILYSQNSSKVVFWRQNTDLSESIDSNYYLRPTSENNKLEMNGVTYGLAAWQSATGYDLHSAETPSETTGALPLIIYNPYHTDSTFTLVGNYKDARGTPVPGGSYVLHGFSSAILFPATLLTYILNNRYNLTK